MMQKLILVVGMVAFLANQCSFVSGHNCIGLQSQNTNGCNFHCIKSIYDKKFCHVCPSKATSELFTSKNFTLAALVQHETIYYNENSDLLIAGNCTDCSDERSSDHFLERYIMPDNLIRFLKCATVDTTIQSDSSSRNNCTTDEINTLYNNITDRLKTENWCIQTFGIDDQYSKIYPHLISVEMLKKNDTINSNNSSDTSSKKESGKQHTISTELLKNNTDEISFTENTVETPQVTESVQSVTSVTELIENNSDMETTHVTSTMTPDETTKLSKPIVANKKKIVEEHHYMASVTIIVIIVGILLSILIISAIVVRVFVNRRKCNQTRSSSTTYVFEDTKRL